MLEYDHCKESWVFTHPSAIILQSTCLWKVTRNIIALHYCKDVPSMMEWRNPFKTPNFIGAVSSILCWIVLVTAKCYRPHHNNCSWKLPLYHIIILIGFLLPKLIMDNYRQDAPRPRLMRALIRSCSQCVILTLRLLNRSNLTAFPGCSLGTSCDGQERMYGNRIETGTHYQISIRNQ